MAIEMTTGNDDRLRTWVINLDRAPERLDRITRQLQRIGICRALINSPTILFGDEPTGALDTTAATEIMDILAELNADGTTLMLVTHDPRIAARTERVLYMVDGRIVGDHRQDRYVGTHLDQRQTDLSQWLMAGEPVSAR